jgi:hypothetical protein
MLRKIPTSLIRPAAGAALFVAAALVAPGDAGAQTTGETAFMNRLQPTVYLPNGLELVYGAVMPAPFAGIDGEQALLARTPGPDRATAVLFEDGTAQVPPSGAYALLGRRETLDPSLR